MIRIVADTNIFISAVMFGGVPGVFLDLAFQGSFHLVTSPILLDELDEKPRMKFELSPADADLIRSRLEAISQLVSTTATLAVIKDDPDDDRVLECAIAGRADYIVSGDRHMLKLGAYENIPIITVRNFMDSSSGRCLPSSIPSPTRQTPNPYTLTRAVRSQTRSRQGAGTCPAP